MRKSIRAIGWTKEDIVGISYCIYTHKIKLEVDHMPILENLRRLNPQMQELVKKQIIKWLDICVVYPIMIVYG